MHQCLLQNHFHVGLKPHFDSSSARNTNKLPTDNHILRYVIKRTPPTYPVTPFIMISCLFPVYIITEFYIPDRLAHIHTKCAYRCFQLFNIKDILSTGSRLSHPSSLFWFSAQWFSEIISSLCLCLVGVSFEIHYIRKGYTIGSFFDLAKVRIASTGRYSVLLDYTEYSVDNLRTKVTSILS